jgi:hypothetical protein
MCPDVGAVLREALADVVKVAPGRAHNVNHGSQSPYRRHAIRPHAKRRARWVFHIDNGSLRRSSSPSTRDVEGAKLHLIVMLAGVQGVAVRDAIDAEHEEPSGHCTSSFG